MLLAVHSISSFEFIISVIISNIIEYLEITDKEAGDVAHLGVYS